MKHFTKFGFWYLMIFMTALILVSFEKRKTFRLEFDEQQVNLLWNVVDQSTAPHNQVKAVQSMLEQQLLPQMDSTKKK